MSVNIGAQVKDASDRTVVTVTGTCKFVGQAAITLTGTFDTSTGALTLTGGGLTFSGSFSNGVLSGTISGTITGSFACLSTSSGTTSLASTTYCGNYTSSPDVGVFNVTVLSNGTLLGAAQPTNGQGRPVTLSGTVNGSTFSGTSSQGVHFSGTISSTTINGSFTADNGFPGSFTGTTAGCQ